MDYVSDAIVITYAMVMFIAIIYTGKKSVGMGFFTGIIFAVMGYIINIPYFNLTMIALVSMALSGTLVYKLFLEDKS
jgi:hypothetical protein